MGFNWNAVAAAGLGVMDGINTYKKQKKEEEILNYNKARQDEIDRQKLELHNQSVQQNNQTLETNAKVIAESNRKEALNKRIGQYQSLKNNNDIESAAKLYIDTANTDNIANPNFNPNHLLSYSVDPVSKTAIINVVDKATGKLVKEARRGVGFDDFISATYQQIDPVGSYANELSGQAELAKENRKNNWELKKLGLENKYDLDKENAKFSNDLKMEKFKQEQENYRSGISQIGQNYRTELTVEGKLKGSAHNAVASGVNGALQFAENNAPLLSFLNNDPNHYLKTMAMMGIESGGENVPSYNGTSLGYMQLNKKYAQGLANQFGIKGDPLKDPQANIQTGAAFIKYLDKKYNGDTSLIAAAYNAGETAIDKALRSWEKSGRNGGWFDHLNVSDAAKQEAYNHILKYNHALSLLDGKQQNTINQANDDYVKGASKVATGSINSVAAKVAVELGLDKKSAPILGGFSGAQSAITRFANSSTTKSRLASYQDVLNVVDKTISSTESGLAMTPQARKEYVHQVAAELVGAANKTEVGLWISNPAKKVKQAQATNRQTPTLSESEIDNVFNDAAPQSNQVQQKSVIPKTLQRPATNFNGQNQQLASVIAEQAKTGVKYPFVLRNQ